MRFLVDASLSPVVAAALRDAGHDAVHVVDLGLVTADDDRILGRAAQDDRVILTADADFGALLAIGGLAKPSVVLLRSADHLGPQGQAALVLANLSQLASDLEAGAVASISRGSVRVRNLPVERPEDV
jgi:predicted nuclease of predicted toxin-antitoxin system